MKNIIKLFLTSIYLMASFSSNAKNIECDYFEDHQQVVHIKGQNEMNLYECLGYFHALDRAYLMDYFRRAGQGRNAEVLGFKNIKNDFFIRALEFEKRAKKIFSDMDDHMKNILISYTNGVNEVFLKKKWNFGGEFKTLGYVPEKWEPHHSIIIIFLQSLNQTSKTFRNDLEESEWLKQYGDEAKDLFNEENVPWFNPILKDGEFKAKDEKKVVSTGSAFDTASPYDFSQDTGSNNWIVSKKLTVERKALLANDPHLDLKRPAFWYWVHLDFSKINVIGSTIPGLPFVISGTTPNLSWGLTNSYYDTADAVLIDESEIKDAPSFRPNVKFKWGPITFPFIFKSYQLVDGKYPIIPIPSPKGKKILFRWSGMDISASDIASYRDILVAKNVEEAKKVFQKMGIPSWNFVFADKNGEIGYQVVGRLPKKTLRTFGAIDLKLKDIHFEFLLPHENPGIINPKREYLITANQRHYPANSFYIGGNGNALSFRGYQIEKLLNDRLKTKKKISIEDFQSIQCDTSATDAEFFVPLLKKNLEPKKILGKDKQALGLLVNWDFSTNASCEACSIYRRFMEILKTDNKINEVALYQLLEKNKIDVANAFSKTVSELWNEKNQRFLYWEEFHRLHFEHISGHEDFDNKESIFTMGDQHSVNPGTARFENGEMIHYSGASQRVVVEMNNPPKVFLSFPGNNRGNYFAIQGDSWNSWKSCHFQTLHFPVDWTKVSLQKNN
jgi:penicillin amidase